MDIETLELLQSNIGSYVKHDEADVCKSYMLKEVRGQFCLLHDNIRGYWIHFSRITLFTPNFNS